MRHRRLLLLSIGAALLAVSPAAQDATNAITTRFGAAMAGRATRADAAAGEAGRADRLTQRGRM